MVVDGDVIELDDILIPALLLELDMVYLCRPDCRGLCPHCGADLNGGTAAVRNPGMIGWRRSSSGWRKTAAVDGAARPRVMQ